MRPLQASAIGTPLGDSQPLAAPAFTPPPSPPPPPTRLSRAMRAGHVFFTVWALSFAFLPFKAVAAGWAALLLPYYAVTAKGAPHRTGAYVCAAARLRLGGRAGEIGAARA